MKRNILAASVAAVAAGNAAAADFDFVIGGATAPTQAIGVVVSDTLCASNVQAVASGDGWVIECTTTAGDDVAFYKNEEGSAGGVAVLDDAAADLQLNDIATLQADGCTIYTSFADATANQCATASTTTRVTDVGVSDVDPRQFVGVLADLFDDTVLPVGGVEQASNINNFANANDLQVSALGSLMFGIVVSDPFYAALQHSQFFGDPTCDPALYSTDADSFDASASSESLECMPSLSRAEIASILSGEIASATSIGARVTNIYGTDYASLYDTAYGYWFASSDGGTMNLCLRNQGSGTHAVTMQYFLRSNCGAVDTRLVAARECDNDASGDDCGVVVGNSGSSDLAACLTAKAGAGEWAMGYQSLEKNANQNDDNGNDYRFVKVDGVAPNLENFLKGDYKEFGNVTAQYRGVNTWSASNGFDSPAEEAAALALFNDLVATFSNDPTALGDLNLSPIFQQAFGEAGWGAQANAPGQPLGVDVNKLVAGHVAKPVNSLVYESLNGVQGLCGTPSTPFGSVDSVE